MKFKSVLFFLKTYLNYWHLIKPEWNGICIIGEKYVNGIIDMCKMSSSKECLQFYIAVINLIEFNLNERLLRSCKTLLSSVFRNKSRVCPNLFYRTQRTVFGSDPKLTQMPFVNLSEKGNTKYTRLTQHGVRVPLILAYK